MIELTDEQINAVEDFSTEWCRKEENTDPAILVKEREEFFVNLLTIDQIKQLAEQHNASVCEWVEFDGDIKNAPNLTKLSGAFSENVITDKGLMYLCSYGFDGKSWWQDMKNEMFPLDYVEKWTYIPEPPK